MGIILDEVRWGMIGCGAVTERKSAPAFNKIEHSRLVAVMGRDPAKATDYAARHGVARWYADAETLIADPEFMSRRHRPATPNTRCWPCKPANRSTWKSRWPAVTLNARQ